MRLLNCGLHEIKEKFGDRKIIFFGCGSWLSAIKHTEFESLKHNFAYAVDNDNSIDSFSLGDDICLKVFLPERLKEETECIVVLTSPVYSYEMYRQLETMHLADGIICYVFAFMQMVTPDYEDKAMLEYIFDNSRTPQIPQTIHSFWFSGEKKPDSYQRCVDSWYRKLDGYEIIEWNMDNYNYHKHPFLERAIELGAWAFAADYARLDVLYEQGGIYLDMDVEVFKSFDNLLANDAILSFSNHVMVDLAVAGAKKEIN